MSRTACRFAANRLVNKALHVREEHAGNLLKATREIKCLSIKGEKDFGDTIHSDKMPPRCVLSGLQTRDIPAPLAKLDRLSRSNEQSAIRLLLGSARTHKVPAYRIAGIFRGGFNFAMFEVEVQPRKFNPSNFNPSKN